MIHLIYLCHFQVIALLNFHKIQECVAPTPARLSQNIEVLKANQSKVFLKSYFDLSF